jgi:hypothetical protein
MADVPVNEFSSDEIKALKLLAANVQDYEEIRKTVERSQWLGRLAWKAAIAAGVVTAGFVTFKNNLMALFRG